MAIRYEKRGKKREPLRRRQVTLRKIKKKTSKKKSAKRGITKKELDKLIEPRGDIEEIRSISWDGSSYLTRIPINIARELGIKKSDNLVWILDKKSNKIELRFSPK